MTGTSERSTTAYVQLSIAVVAVSCAAPLIRLSDSEPLTVAFWRVALAALGALLIMVAVPRWRSQRGPWGLCVLAGVFLGLHFWVWIGSLAYTSVANSVLLVTTQPIWAALIARIFLRERVPAAGVVGIALALTGSALTFGYEGIQLQGDLMAVIGGILAAAYMVVGRRQRQRWDTLPYLARVYGSAALLLAIGLVITGGTFLATSDSDWWLFAALAAVPTGIGHSLYNVVLKHLPTYVVATSITGEPVGASLLAIWWLGEFPPDRTLLAASLIIAGIILVSRRGRSAAGAPVS